MEEVCDQRTYQLLNHYVLLEEFRKQGVFRNDVSETRHNLVKLPIVVQLHIETKILLLFKDYQIFAHPQCIAHPSIDAICVLNLVNNHSPLEVNHK